jgi:ATP-dependent dihydroxyacetone kinase
MKKLINDAKSVVREMLEGVVALAPHLAILENENVVVRTDLPEQLKRKVAVISGGGAGHEPAHAGYVGQGMLSAAVVGDVFTSPSVDAVLAAIRAVSGPAGALLVVKNYTGDRLNFGLAAELARAEGIPAEVVLVGDDVSLRNTVTADRRRGIAGTVFVHKLAGAVAEQGRSLAEVADSARKAAGDVRTMGVGLGSCIVPALGHAGFSLGEDEIEFGLGIHGEKGVERTRMKPVDAIVDDILDIILADFGPDLPAGFALLVNGLGATPPMELAIVLRGALSNLAERGLKVGRAWCGNFMTALEMPGFSISLLPLDDERLVLLDSDVSAAGWQGSGALHYPLAVIAAEEVAAAETAAEDGPVSAQLRSVASAVAAALEAAEAELSDLDSKAGDGDLGASMVRGANAIRELSSASYSTPSRFLTDLGSSVRRAIAGSSGPFYATALVRAARQLQGQDNPAEADWRRAFAAAIEAISELGGAKRGDRTMLDALYPALDAWSAGFAAAALAAREGAMATENLKPKVGRASYLGDRALGIPDGGATAVAIWMDAIDKVLHRD